MNVVFSRAGLTSKWTRSSLQLILVRYYMENVTRVSISILCGRNFETETFINSGTLE